MHTNHSVRKSAAALAVAVSTLLLGRASAQTMLLDTVTNANNFTATGSTPHDYMGDGFTNNALPVGTASFQITGFTFYLVANATTTYNDVDYRIQFWNTANGNGSATSATSPAFSNAAAGLVTVDLGAISTTANTFTAYTVNLNTPITLRGGSGTNWGFVQNFQSIATAGGAFADDPNLESLIPYNTNDTFAAGAITTGTAPAFGYYRNANGETNFNFTSTSRSLGVDYEGVGIQIFGNPVVVPEPSSVTLAILGGFTLLGCARFACRQAA